MTSPIKAWMQDAYGNGLRTRTYYDFFAGAGLVRVALGPAWRCLWANDIDSKKKEVYVRNFGDSEFVWKDIAQVKGSDLPCRAELELIPK